MEVKYTQFISETPETFTLVITGKQGAILRAAIGKVRTKNREASDFLFKLYNELNKGSYVDMFSATGDVELL
jgi:hypothetical protein